MRKPKADDAAVKTAFNSPVWHGGKTLTFNCSPHTRGTEATPASKDHRVPRWVPHPVVTLHVYDTSLSIPSADHAFPACQVKFIAFVQPLITVTVSTGFTGHVIIMDRVML